MGVAALRRDPTAALAAALLGVAMGLLAARQPLLAATLILAVIGLVIVLTHAELVLLAMVVALPWQEKLHFPSATFSTVKGIGLLVTLAYIVRLIANRRTTVHLPALLGIVSLLGIWIGISFIFSPNPSEGTEKLVRWMLFFAFFFLIVQLVDGRAEIKRVLRWFTVSVAAAALYASWLFVVAHNSYRASGPLEDPNDFAYLLACTLPIAAYLMSTGHRIFWGLCFTVIAAAMLATFSRGALVGIGALLVWGVATRRVPLWALVSGLATAALVAALAFTLWRPLLNTALHQKAHIANSNVQSREALWSAAIQLSERRPLVGVGPNRFGKEAPPLLRNNPIVLEKPVTHNSYLEILAEDGIPALLLFIAYLVTAWLLLRQAQRRAARAHDADGLRLATALTAALLIAIVAAAFVSQELAPPFWLLGGLAVVLARDRAPSPRRQSSGRERGAPDLISELAPAPG